MKLSKASQELSELIELLQKSRLKFNARLRSTVVNKLLGLGFIFMTDGCYKEVYIHPKYKFWVVKVLKSTRHRDCEPNALPKHLQKYYLEPSFKRGRISIQRRVRVRGQAEATFYKLFSKKNLAKYDIHNGNVGSIGKRVFIIDFLVGECKFGL